MPMMCAGIDEAGYGPLLGPLTIVIVAAAADDDDALADGFRCADTGAGDSKEIHTPGDIAAIERVALAAIAWLTGGIPACAAAAFALLGETADDRDAPWMAGAETLALPVAADEIPRWSIPGVAPLHLDGRLVHPLHLNRGRTAGLNKADMELERIGGLLRRLPADHDRRSIMVDRLGGRVYYADFLRSTWPSAEIMTIEEITAASRYSTRATHGEDAISFRVNGEAASPLIAIASCIAKYVRELHLLLFNRYWCALRPGLKPTAGYAADAKRWLDAIGNDAVAADGERLVRGWSNEATWF